MISERTLSVFEMGRENFPIFSVTVPTTKEARKGIKIAFIMVSQCMELCLREIKWVKETEARYN